MKPITIAFTRLFTRGNLVGLTHDDHLSFTTRATAARWVRGIRHNSRRGLLAYKLASIRVLEPAA